VRAREIREGTWAGCALCACSGLPGRAGAAARGAPGLAVHFPLPRAACGARRPVLTTWERQRAGRSGSTLRPRARSMRWPARRGPGCAAADGACSWRRAGPRASCARRAAASAAAAARSTGERRTALPQAVLDVRTCTACVSLGGVTRQEASVLGFSSVREAAAPRSLGLHGHMLRALTSPKGSARCIGGPGTHRAAQRAGM